MIARAGQFLAVSIFHTRSLGRGTNRALGKTFELRTGNFGRYRSSYRSKERTISQAYNKILVVQDAYRDSVEALEWAARLVPSNGHVKVLDIQPPLSTFWQELFSSEFDQTPAYHRQAALSELACGVEFPTKDVTGDVRRGTPVVQVVREAINGEHDLVIKEAQAKASDIVFGSLDMRLLRYCPVPFWLSHPNSKGHDCRRVLVALNPDAGKKEMMLNARLLQHASAVAIGFNSKLYVVGAYQSHVTAFPLLDRDSLKRMEQHSANAQSLARGKLDSLIRGGKKAIDPKHIILDDGPPGEVILGAVRKVKPDLLVMGSVARHGPSGLLVGNAAERVFRQVSCSILTIKPQNFVTPIEVECRTSPDDGSAQLAF